MKSSIYARIVLTGAILVSGCVRTIPAARVADDTGTRTGTLSCEAGKTLQSFHLQVNSALPRESDDVPLFRPVGEGNDTERLRTLVAPGEKSNINLDVCANEDLSDPRLVRIVAIAGNDSFCDFTSCEDYLEKRLSVLAEVNPHWQVDGLSEALFGDYSRLRIHGATLMFEENGYRAFDTGVFIQGATIGGVSTVIAAFSLASPNEEPYFNTRAVFAGDIAFGGFRENEKCETWENARESQFEFGTARFEAVTCDYLRGGPSGELSLRFVELKVSDSNPALGANPVSIALTPEQLADPNIFRVHVMHHKVAYGFTLNLPGASYIGVSSYMARMDIPDGPTVEQQSKASYRVRYAEGPWSDVTLLSGRDFLAFPTVNPGEGG